MSFDLDDTLYDNHPFILRAEQKLLAFLQQHSPSDGATDTQYWRRLMPTHNYAAIWACCADKP
jgi:FMN phosphatase YigB (HAD superfamily)